MWDEAESGRLEKEDHMLPAWQRLFRTSVVFICSRLAARLPAFSAMLAGFLFTLHMIFDEIFRREHYFLILRFEHASTVTAVWLYLKVKP